MLFRLFSYACVAVGLGLGSYTTSHQQKAPQPTTHWVLSTLDGKPLLGSRAEERPLLVLSETEAGRGAHDKCPFQPSVAARLLCLPRVISTMMRSSDEEVEAELRYLSVLAQTTHFEMTNNTLRLYSAGQAAPVATFKAGQSL